jgi:hypothetical protein
MRRISPRWRHAPEMPSLSKVVAMLPRFAVSRKYWRMSPYRKLMESHPNFAERNIQSFVTEPAIAG